MPCPENFRESLGKSGIDGEIIRWIAEGYEEVTSKSPKRLRAEYFARATEILSENVDEKTLADIMGRCACCKSGARLKASKAFAKEHAGESFQEKLEAISAVPNMGRPVWNEDGTITIHAVAYWKDDRYSCACSQFNGVRLDLGVSRNYCYCCAGHFRYHYEIMLGVKLRPVEIVSSPLDSDGKNPCVIRFEVEE